jgi:hypothetical protein
MSSSDEEDDCCPDLEIEITNGRSLKVRNLGPIKWLIIIVGAVTLLSGKVVF